MGSNPIGATWKIQAPVVQTMDSAIRRINHYPLVHWWIVIYLVDSATHRLNWGQVFTRKKLSSEAMILVVMNTILAIA